MHVDRKRKVSAVHLTSIRLGSKLGEHTQLMRVFAVVAALYSLSYLVWRIVATSQGVPAVLFWLLWSAEFVGWLSLALFVKDAWDQSPEKHRFGQVAGKVVVLIPTFDEALAVIEPTLMAAMKIQNQHEVWLLDDGNRPWVKKLAKEYGAKYLTRSEHTHAKAGNINHALEKVSSDFVLVLDADHVASPQIINRTLGYFVDPLVALVQTPHDFRNLDSAQHVDNEVNEQSLFFDILLPGRQRSGAVFWCGSGGLLRASALREIGGLSTTTITEDLETTLALNRSGYRSVYHNERLLLGLAPQNISSFLLQRYRWARGTLAILLGSKSPLVSRGFGLSARLSYLSNLVYYITPIQHMVFIGVLIWTLITAQAPVIAPINSLLFFWLPQLALTLFSIWGLSRGRQLPFGGSKNAWITSSIYMRALFDALTKQKASFKVTPKTGVEKGGLATLRLMWLPVCALAGLLLAASLRLTQISGLELGLGYMGPDMLFYVFVFTFFETAILLPLIVNSASRVQSRFVWREPVDVLASIAGKPGRVLDLHEAGLKFTTQAGNLPKLKVGDVVAVTLNLNLGSAKVKKAKGNVKITACFLSQDGTTLTAGGAASWNSDQDRKRVVEFCYLVTPERARHEQ